MLAPTITSLFINFNLFRASIPYGYILEQKWASLSLTPLSEAAEMSVVEMQRKQQLSLSFLRTILYLLSKKRLLPLEHNVKAASLTHDTLMLDVVSYLNTACPEDLRLEDISEQFYVSKNTLCARFCSAMSCSPMQYLAFVRLSHVKELLSTTSKKIDEIAALCGYSSPNYIILIFKKASAFHQTNTEKQSKVYIIALIPLYNRKADMRYAYPLFSFTTITPKNDTKKRPPSLENPAAHEVSRGD